MEYSKGYNYHSHTFRCGHAADVPDSVYIENAIGHGYKKYGITDHVPVHPIFFGDSTVRMHDSDKFDYYYSVNRIKDLYKDMIDVYLGYEAEYDEIIEDYLCDLREDCDYMIMGQHYVLNKNIRNSVDYPLEYAKKVCAGIESGIFDIVAHPDIFMQYRISIPESMHEEYFNNAVIASHMICLKAKEYNIPLELNLGATHVYNSNVPNLSVEEISIFNEKNARYPTSLFWSIASEIGNSVVVGIDAHYPAEIAMKEAKLKRIGSYIDLSKLNILDEYDPVIARSNNSKLQEAYENTRRNASCVESRLVTSYLEEIIDDEDDNVNKNKVKTELIRKLRELPESRKFMCVDDNDNFTVKKREDLIKVIKEKTRQLPSGHFDKKSYIGYMSEAINGEYKKKSIIEIDALGNVLEIKNRFR